jgi:hypothetical protein
MNILINLYDESIDNETKIQVVNATLARMQNE